MCTWIVELKLNEINDIQSSMESDKITQEEKDKLSDEWQCRMVSFRQFLEEHQAEIDQETIF